jgi:hypothetical protein
MCLLVWSHQPTQCSQQARAASEPGRSEGATAISKSRQERHVQPLRMVPPLTRTPSGGAGFYGIEALVRAFRDRLDTWQTSPPSHVKPINRHLTACLSLPLWLSSRLALLCRAMPMTSGALSAWVDGCGIARAGRSIGLRPARSGFSSMWPRLLPMSFDLVFIDGTDAQG